MLGRLRSHRPGHATVVAYLALFVALGGSSYAAIQITGKNVPKDALTGKDIKKLTGKDVTNNSLTGLDVRGLGSGDVTNGRLLAEDFAPGQLPAGAQGEKGDKGDKGNDGTQGAAGATNVVVRWSEAGFATGGIAAEGDAGGTGSAAFCDGRAASPREDRVATPTGLTRVAWEATATARARAASRGAAMAAGEARLEQAERPAARARAARCRTEPTVSEPLLALSPAKARLSGNAPSACPESGRWVEGSRATRAARSSSRTTPWPSPPMRARPILRLTASPRTPGMSRPTTRARPVRTGTQTPSSCGRTSSAPPRRGSPR